ncbi:MAG: hypothetical protein B7X28_05210 [Halothiobacillus sp. 13-55-253]|nr:MAG: hypothetical protein B7X28_05210 [Halothiobacillus sp. 13-55-253]
MRGSRKIALIALTAAATVMFSAASQADGSTQIYKWVDKNGETHFSQLPPKQGEAQIDLLKKPRMKPRSPWHQTSPFWQ